MDRGRKVRLLGFYGCLFCHMDQSSAGFSKGSAKWSVFVWRPGLLSRVIGHWLGCLHGDGRWPLALVSTPSCHPHCCSCFFKVCPAVLHLRSSTSCSWPQFKAPAGHQDSQLSVDLRLLRFSLEPSGHSLFNVMAVNFNKSHRYGQFKCIFSVV